MGLAGEPEQNLWKERSCGQNLDIVRLSDIELDLQNEFSFALRGFVVSHLYPGLAPWAAIFRRFAAEIVGRAFSRGKSQGRPEQPAGAKAPIIFGA